MAEKEETRVHPQKRNTTYSNRGHPGQNRLYNQLGVKDLRELLDRKRSERGYVNEPHVPPPDPSYSYLKDPLRENDDNNPMRHNNTRKFHNKNNPSNNMKRDLHGGGNHPKNRDIENPLNIKVEFSTSTGEHVYKMDETTILPTIKHVPDRPFHQGRPFRGRGRGRGRGQQRTYQTRTIRSNNLNKRTPKNSVTENAPAEHLQPAFSNADENWDNELNEHRIQSAENEEFGEAVDNEPCEEEEYLQNALEAAVQNLNLDKNKSESESTTEHKCDENKPQIENTVEGKCDEKKSTEERLM